MDSGSLEFAQARVQARHGQRLDAVAWRRIELLRDFAPSLELARATALRPWLVGVAADSGVAQIEAALRRHWRALVMEVAGWMPVPWRSAIVWCAWLPDLPLLQHLARGGASPPWLVDDEIWRGLAAAPAAERASVLAAGPPAALAGAWPTPDALGHAWLTAWRSLLPRQTGDGAESLDALVRMLREHAAVFAAAAPSQGGSLRSALQAKLSLLLRRAAMQPAIAFIHIALCALDLERLRGELVRRVVFRNWMVA